MTRLLLVLALALGALAAPVAAQVTSTGIIKGRVIDAETGESMPYTNIYIAGTSIGTMAFTDGYFFLRGLRPGTYTVTADDVALGYIENTALAEGTDSNGDPVTDVSDAGDDAVETPDGEGVTDGDPTNDPTVQMLDQEPSIRLYKTIASIDDVNSNGVTDLGDEITYTFTVTNTGNVPVTGVVINDSIVLIDFINRRVRDGMPLHEALLDAGRLDGISDATDRAEGRIKLQVTDGTIVAGRALAVRRRLVAAAALEPHLHRDPALLGDLWSSRRAARRCTGGGHPR